MEGVTRGQLGDERAAHKPPNEMKQVQGGCGEAQPDALSHGTFVNRLYRNPVPQTSSLRDEERGVFSWLSMLIGQSLSHGALSPHVGFWEAAGDVRSQVLLHGASSKSRCDGRIRVFTSCVLVDLGTRAARAPTMAGTTDAVSDPSLTPGEAKKPALGGSGDFSCGDGG